MRVVDKEKIMEEKRVGEREYWIKI